MTEKEMIQEAIDRFQELHGSHNMLTGPAVITAQNQRLHPERIARISIPAVINMTPTTWEHVIVDPAIAPLTFEEMQAIE